MLNSTNKNEFKITMKAQKYPEKSITLAFLVGLCLTPDARHVRPQKLLVWV